MTGRRVRYRAGHLITGQALTDPERAVVADGVVDVVDGRVEWSGRASGAPDEPLADEVRLPGVVLPAFVDPHCHTPMTLFRGAGEGLPVDRWLDEVMWPRESRLTPDDVAAGMALGAVELLTAGVATTCEMYFHAPAIAEAAGRVHVRTVITAPFIETPHFAGLGPVADQLAAAVDHAERFAADPLVTIGLGPHSGYALSADVLGSIAELAERHDLLVHVHVAELPNENAMTAHLGPTVVRGLDALGLLRPSTVAAHCVHVDDADLDLLAERGVGVAHCPVSNMRHANGVAPLAAMTARGIDVGLATDGPASHPRLDPFDEMRTAIRLHRVHSGDASVLDPADALRLMTAGGADVLGRPDLGRLLPGCRADMVHLDPTRLGMGPVLETADLVGHLVWGGSREAVRDVWVDGRASVADGVPVGVEVDELQAEVAARAAALAQAGS